ncbi:reverse transcriptase domain-containing protein [Tanacetum coccineum]|uniref:Reverse transcriptase domain-containing protein n=1 Tax=Tanacetum coccineum TaxID=301880 RepID=A0ABQ5CJD4_9ASTR
MSSIKAWDEIVAKMKKKLFRWKLNTLSVGGRLTLLKSVLGSTPIYNMSIFKVPKFVLNYMKSLRRNFFNGVQEGDRKIDWVKWSKVLASKKFGGLGVSSFFALNSLKDKGVDLISHCKIRVGKGTCTSFWNDLWIGDSILKLSFPRLFALEENKVISVADKLHSSISSFFRRPVRGGEEAQQLDQLSVILDSVSLSNMDDRWYWDLNGDGVFLVKDVRSLLNEVFLPKMDAPTRWIKCIPIKLVLFVTTSLKTRLTYSLVVQLRKMFRNLFVDGGIWMFNLTNHMIVGSLGSNLSDLDLRRKMCWNASFTFLGGAFDDVERYTRNYEAYEQFLAMTNQEARGSGSGIKRTRTYIPCEREEAEQRLLDDYFGNDDTPPKYPEDNFRRKYRMSSTLFAKIVNDITSYDAQPLLEYFCFFRKRIDALSRNSISPILKITSAIRQLAYGTAPDAFDEYLQIDERCSRECLDNFKKCIYVLYVEEYLRKPSLDDIEKTYALHEEKHRLPGMLESIDCMHWDWRNCPKALHGQFKRKDHKYLSHPDNGGNTGMLHNDLHCARYKIIMPPRMRTQSAGRPAAESLGGGTGERVGRGGRGRRPREEGVNGNVEGANRGAPDFSTIIAQQLQNLLPAMLAQVSNRGNVGNQNGNVVNENVQENVGNVIVNGNRVGCSYKEFLACNPKEYDGKGGVVVLTRWIEKMEYVHDMSGCSVDQKVKYTAGSFVGKALTWWNSQIRMLGREVAISMPWNDFKFMLIQEFCPSIEMQKLESELWNHAMVGAGMLRICIGLHSLLGLS